MPVPQQLWEDLSMDFITDLPLSQGNTVIWVVIDRFSKMAHFIPMKALPTVANLSVSFITHIFRLHGLPQRIISDRGSQFTSRFWRALCSAFGVTTLFSSAYHPQTNGMVERVNQTAKAFLRAYSNQRQDDWATLLPWAEFAYNNNLHSASQTTPFSTIYGHHPRLPPPVFPAEVPPQVQPTVRSLQDVWKKVQEQLQRAAVKAKEIYDRRRQAAPTFLPGEKVWLSTRYLRLWLPSLKFAPQFIGPFAVRSRIGAVTYRLHLPSQLRVHNAFHVSLLKPFRRSKWHPEPKRVAVPDSDPDPEYEVDRILDSKRCGRIDLFQDKLDLSDENVQALHTSDCSSPDALRACITAVDTLHCCMSIQLKPGHRKLQAVAEQLIKFENLRQSFEKHFVTHITTISSSSLMLKHTLGFMCYNMSYLLILMLDGSDQGSALMHQAGRLTSPKHTSYHQELLPYIPLMAWLKSSNAVIFNELSKVYSQNLSKLYEKEIKAFFEVAKLLLGRSKEGRRFSLHEGLDKLSSSTTSLHKHYLRLSENTDEQLNELDQRNVAKVLEQVLTQLEPMCRKEESFINSFFLLTDSRCPEDLQSELPLKSDTHVSYVSEDPQNKECKASNGLGDMAAHWLNEIFNCLEPELRTFVNTCSKVSQFSCIQVLVTVNNYTLKIRNDSEPSSSSSSSLSSTFFDCIISNILLLAKNSFSKCVFSLCKEIEEAKVPGKKKIGILPFISRFKDFVVFSEDVFRNAEQRRDLDKALGKLMDTVFNSINSLSTLKVNANMVIMENFHHIYCFLSEMKIHSLESKRKEAKQRYSEHLDKYVIKHLGQPLQKLNCFLDGIKACIAQGLKEEDVSFQLAYSKQELRKVTEKYPGKEVKKSLEMLHGKILKHLSPEENLLPVVWHAMQQEFLRQYKEIEDMISRCYPGSGVAMEFTVQDVLNYFITITQLYQ
ncbi:exocyst complex component 1 [Microcaecilia unicolor]|uniref:Exocyst complex component 1-like n=1 Tax=Microcaecilia unicolor TaxID=1415580 RepID=A0A6P7YTL5_9AMPH|nr:exocyst complex component 1-like [Microcaecilia unicolor]